jgi:NO-binding membrane sensor protein with MHYT domain
MTILIISIIAAFGFAAAARKKGYRARRFWIYPLAVGAGIAAMGFVLGLLFSLIPNLEHSFLARIYPAMIAILSILVFLGWLSKAWKEIKALPDHGNPQPGETPKIPR